MIRLNGFLAPQPPLKTLVEDTISIKTIKSLRQVQVKIMNFSQIMQKTLTDLSINQDLVLDRLEQMGSLTNPLFVAPVPV